MPCAAQSSCITCSIVKDLSAYSLIDLRFASASSTETDPEVFGCKPVWTTCDTSAVVGFGSLDFHELTIIRPTAAARAPPRRPRKDLRLNLCRDTRDTLLVVRLRTTYPARLSVYKHATKHAPAYSLALAKSARPASTWSTERDLHCLRLAQLAIGRSGRKEERKETKPRSQIGFGSFYVKFFAASLPLSTASLPLNP
jgi:hypothetical protein